jgi:hypothetical protein
MDVLFISGLLLVVLVTLGLVLARLYRRASKEISYVRTASAGRWSS